MIFAVLNDFLASGSRSFQQDAVGLREFLFSLPTEEYSDDKQLNKQLQICAIVASFLTWASLHQEDYNEIARWWASEVAPGLRETYEESKHGRP